MGLVSTTYLVLDSQLVPVPWPFSLVGFDAPDVMGRASHQSFDEPARLIANFAPGGGGSALESLGFIRGFRIRRKKLPYQGTARENVIKN